MARARLGEAARVLQEICAADLNARDIVVSLAKASTKSDIPTFERLSITDDLAEEFRAAIARTLSQIGHELDQGDTVVVPYNPGSNPDIHEMEFVDLRAEACARSSSRSTLPESYLFSMGPPAASRTCAFTP
jgi:hypothetical protein